MQSSTNLQYSCIEREKIRRGPRSHLLALGGVHAVDGQIVREIDRLDPLKALSKMRLHAQRVLDSQSNKQGIEKGHTTVNTS